MVRGRVPMARSVPTSRVLSLTAIIMVLAAASRTMTTRIVPMKPKMPR